MRDDMSLVTIGADSTGATGNFAPVLTQEPGQSSVGLIGGGRGQWLGGHHGECGARAYNGGLGAEAPEAESILVIGCPMEPANLAPLVKFSK